MTDIVKTVALSTVLKTLLLDTSLGTGWSLTNAIAWKMRAKLAQACQ
jgi:hypothetical protein